MNNFFRGWLPEMIGYAHLICRETDLRRAWLMGDFSTTSVISPGEMFSHFFDGEKMPELFGMIKLHLGDHVILEHALVDFISKLKALQIWSTSRTDTIHNIDILLSEQWRSLRSSACVVVTRAEEAGFSENDFDPPE